MNSLLKHSNSGVSIRTLHFSMLCISLLISILLLVATISARTGYYSMRDTTYSYIMLERDATNLQVGSDYLTEQVRCFVETGKREYMDNYFQEAKVTRRRDKALLSIESMIGDTEACAALESAMKQSILLMDREYYAMRLTLSAYGYDLDDAPEEIKNVTLTEEDALLSREQQAAQGRAMVFDDVYRLRKDNISRSVQSCLDTLTNDVDSLQQNTTERLDELLVKQRVLIVAAISLTFITLLLTTLLVISPLVRAVLFIRADEPIPIKGSNEFQFLAKTYNLMYEANRQQKEQLAFEAAHDKLTGLYNRNGYDFLIKNVDWNSACLLLIDADEFKSVNDTYGHEVGDRVLQRVAETIKKSFRAQDYVCRIGGDEFAVIMVCMDHTHAGLIKSKIRAINDALIPAKGDVPGIHVSCGVAYGARREDFRAIFRAADAALYSVKNDGGDGCIISL